VVFVHALLAVVVLGAVALWGTGSDPAGAATQVTAPDPDPRLPGPESLALVRPPGTVVLDNTRVKRGDVPATVLPEAEAQAVTAAGVVSVKALVSRDGAVSRGVWQLAVRNGGDAGDALRAIDDLYAAGGWQPADSPAPGVVVRAQVPGEGQPYSGYRAHYVRGPYLIRIEAYGTAKALVDREFAALARRQLAEWPPR
jgi:hypothetical protein